MPRADWRGRRIRRAAPGKPRQDRGGTGDRFLRLATAFAAEVAVPCSPFPQRPLRKDIGDKVDKKPGKPSGIAYNAFPMNLVNGTLPPDYTTLLCFRPDALGGGAPLPAAGSRRSAGPGGGNAAGVVHVLIMAAGLTISRCAR